VLRQEYEVVSYFYNPNISPREEYDRRFNELAAYSNHEGFQLYQGIYDPTTFYREVKEYRFLGERSERCWQCYRLRLVETFRKGKELGIDTVTTVLSISPHKDAGQINRIGRELAEEMNMTFLEADFKKKNGFKRSLEISKERHFYRQTWCGCIYSRLEREKHPVWLRKMEEYKKNNH
jgi:epoxyqueuosine reductase